MYAAKTQRKNDKMLTFRSDADILKQRWYYASFRRVSQDNPQ